MYNRFSASTSKYQTMFIRHMKSLNFSMQQTSRVTIFKYNKTILTIKKNYSLIVNSNQGQRTDSSSQRLEEQKLDGREERTTQILPDVLAGDHSIQPSPGVRARERSDGLQNIG